MDKFADTKVEEKTQGRDWKVSVVNAQTPLRLPDLAVIALSFRLTSTHVEWAKT